MKFEPVGARMLVEWRGSHGVVASCGPRVADFIVGDRICFNVSDAVYVSDAVSTAQWYVVEQQFVWGRVVDEELPL